MQQLKRDCLKKPKGEETANTEIYVEMAAL
jgi:hypothetical protein